MSLRIQLISNNFAPLIEEIADPIGINSLTQTVKRSEKNTGIIYEIIVDLAFLKDGRRYLKQCYEVTGGVDAQVSCLIYDYNPNLRKWELWFEGQVNFNKWELDEDQLAVAIEQTGFERRLLNLKATEVDLETAISENGSGLPAQSVRDILYHSKKLFLQFLGTMPQETVDFDFLMIEDSGTDTDPGFLSAWLQFTFTPTVDEVADRFDYPFYPTRRYPPNLSKYMFKFKNDINLTINNLRVVGRCQALTNTFVTEPLTYGFYIIHGRPGAYTTITIKEETVSDYSQVIEINELYSNTFTFAKGDEFYFFSKIKTTSTGALPIIATTYRIENFLVVGPDTFENTADMSGLSTFPETTVKGVLIHEALQRVLQYYTNQEDCLRTSLCGRPEITMPDGSTPYTEDGKGAMIALNNGNNIRGRSTRQIFHSFDSIFEFINANYCAGFGFETINGKQVVRVEKIDYFYNKNSKILSLGKVKVKRKFDPRRVANMIEFGYAGKVDISQVNAIDEFNTIRRFRIPIVNTKNEIKVATKMRAGGYQIEAQRRLTGATEDGKLDDENFATVVIRDGDEFKTKKDEGYSAFTNVIDSASGYNYDISPARGLQEWLTFVASVVIRSLNKIITFATGEVNFEMTSQKTTESSPLAENGSVDLTGIEPIWDHELYELKDIPFTRDDMKLVKANPYGYIDFEDNFEETFEGFIEQIEYDPNEHKADLLLLKVFRP